MIEDRKHEELRREFAREILQHGEEGFAQSLAHITLTWATWDRLREKIRRQYLDMWLDDIARRLGRPRSTIRLLSIAETYALQVADIEAAHRWQTGQIPGFEHEISVAQPAEIERLIDVLRLRIPDTPVHLLCGANINLLSSDEPDRRQVWLNASGLFGAVEATSTEILANATMWVEGDEYVDITVLNASPGYDVFTLGQGATGEGVFYVAGLTGMQWGRLLADEQSDWDYVRLMEQAVGIRARNLK